MNKRINTYDIETLCIKGNYIGFCVSFNFKNENYNFYCKEVIKVSMEKILDLLKKEENIVFYVHNLNFDGMLILEYLSRSGLKFKIMSIKTNLYYIRVKIGKKTVEWRCSFKLMPFSLEIVSSQIDGYKKMKYPYEILNENFNDKIKLSDVVKNINEYETYLLDLDLKSYTILYCNNDVVITKKIVETFWETLKNFEIKINSNNYSISSIAVNLFFKKYNKFNIDKKLDKVIDKYVRKAYYGGRCEVFGNPRNNEKIFHFDFKGMYGQCMLEKFPVGRHDFRFDIKEIMKPGFYSIEWEWSGKYPILPLKDNVFGKLMFYEGKGEGLYWYEEILLFEKYGGKIMKINSCLIFEKEERVFESFVNDMDKIRERGGIYKMVGKLLVNSMYGRLGMGRENLSSVVSFDGKPHPLAERFFIMNDVVISEIKKEMEYNGIYNVVMAAVITAKARVKLYRAFMSVIENGGRILYTDTDSVIASFLKDVLGERHGEVYWDEKKKDTLLEKACFALPKTYSIVINNNESITKIKGFRKNFVRFEEFEKQFLDCGMIKENDFIFIKKSGYSLRIENSTKETNLMSYNKRRWIDNYKDTLPFKR